MVNLSFFPRLLLVGLWPRLVLSAVIVIALWAGYFWATATPGGA